MQIPTLDVYEFIANEFVIKTSFHVKICDAMMILDIGSFTKPRISLIDISPRSLVRVTNMTSILGKVIFLLYY